MTAARDYKVYEVTAAGRKLPSLPVLEGFTEGYTYSGCAGGLHVFTDSAGRRQLFRRTMRAPACWHLKRGAYCFEFVRSCASVQP